MPQKIRAQAYPRVPEVERVGIANRMAEKFQPLAQDTGRRAFRDDEAQLPAGVDTLNVCRPPQPHWSAAETGRWAEVA